MPKETFFFDHSIFFREFSFPVKKQTKNCIGALRVDILINIRKIKPLKLKSQGRRTLLPNSNNINVFKGRFFFLTR